jgi:hypothetical protein
MHAIERGNLSSFDSRPADRDLAVRAAIRTLPEPNEKKRVHRGV